MLKYDLLSVFCFAVKKHHFKTSAVSTKLHMLDVFLDFFHNLPFRKDYV